MNLITKLYAGVAAAGIGLSTLATPSLAGGKKPEVLSPEAKIQRDAEIARVNAKAEHNLKYIGIPTMAGLGAVGYLLTRRPRQNPKL